LKHIRQAGQRLGTNDFTPHTIEMALWTHNVLLQHKPELLQTMPNGIAPQEDSLGSTISNGSKDVDEDSNSNTGLNPAEVSPNEDSNLGTESERGEDSNSVDAFQAHMKKNGLAAAVAAGLNTDSNDSSSLQNGQISSTEEDGTTITTLTTLQSAGTKREAPIDDENANDAGDSSLLELGSSDEPLLKKVKLIESLGAESNSSSEETHLPPILPVADPTPIEATNGDGH